MNNNFKALKEYTSVKNLRDLRHTAIKADYTKLEKKDHEEEKILRFLEIINSEKDEGSQKQKYDFEKTTIRAFFCPKMKNCISRVWRQVETSSLAESKAKRKIY